ncbi:DmsC/YnfH family molybdoenzyme membrane anchor subunit [Biostraticola tofi]|uniref:Anaerobic dimethyl sulfoxide reductase subunit C (Anchor subunit) n=1 Tax=Biostraticola tofi TaxID=466109 RepID=A0A4R3YVW0_9GAMM|nr:DmsC/YnfH family molybdoenzyme membrane anchor subunit [Biostraticola tofi]TCV96642.1 anaerobic dimethyl sulfoxide reductase subunit C (anchor subunit) [Biostraticola tofi]
MGNGWHEWPLMFFTVAGQCVIGGYLVMAMLLLAGHLGAEHIRRVQRAMFYLWLLMGLGFIASMMHLGSPLRAMNALNRLGASALSNEIAAGSLFFALGGLYWLLAVLNRMPRALDKLWLVAIALSGLLFLYAMGRVYFIDTVPTWANAYTPLGFILTVFIGGPLLGYLLLQSAGVSGPGWRYLPWVSVIAVLASLVVVVMQASTLAGIQSSVQQASALVPDYGLLMAGRIVLLSLGLACWLIPIIRDRTPAPAGLMLGMVLVLAGELIGRGVFYGLHMTVGMAVAG